MVAGQAGLGAPPAGGTTVEAAGDSGSLFGDAGQALHARARGEHMLVVLQGKS